MKKKALGLLSVTGLLAMAVSFLTPGLAKSITFRVNGICNHVGSHIEENAKFGIKEYYVCCGCNEHWLAGNQPQGSWTNKRLKDEEYIEVANYKDDRYRAPNYWEVNRNEAKLTWSSDGNNVIDTSAIEVGDVLINLSQSYVDEHNTEGSQEFVVKFKALSSTGSIWAMNPAGAYFGDSMVEGKIYKYDCDLKEKIILRNGAKVEELSVAFVNDYEEFDLPWFASDGFSFEKDNDGFITSVTLKTDGINDFDNKVGLSTAYMKKLADKGYSSMTFDLTRTGGNLARMHSNGSVSYPGNGQIEVDINGDYPLHIDACLDGGLLCESTITLSNFQFYNKKEIARETLAKKFNNPDTAWSYIHHGSGNNSVSADGSTYYLNNPCNFVLTNHLVCLAREAGYRYLYLRVRAYDPESGTIGQVGFITENSGGAWDRYWSYKEGNEYSFCLDLDKWPADLADTSDNYVAHFYGRDAGGNNLNCKFEIEILGYFESDEVFDLLAYNAKKIGEYPDNTSKDLYVRFKYLSGNHWRAPIWGNSSSHIIDGKSFDSCTNLSDKEGYGAGWYEFKINAGSLQADGELWLCGDAEGSIAYEIGFDSAA